MSLIIKISQWSVVNNPYWYTHIVTSYYAKLWKIHKVVIISHYNSIITRSVFVVLDSYQICDVKGMKCLNKFAGKFSLEIHFLIDILLLQHIVWLDVAWLTFSTICLFFVCCSYYYLWYCMITIFTLSGGYCAFLWNLAFKNY